ncbi:MULTISPECIES: hypothetical protein [unclassified Guyparkeria]|uniref:hypothetical protein n=1 Tax=unclassified Guyparkeria TaxID=2626246 RepID=UPI00073BEE29|nr:MULTISPECIES: hypothetical protein [unclassified Guyparkeria]KTG15896.1 hypothetical protein AUR63_06150 [Guyparkeria sp. XI15]OAE84646.1 hypothetical protein AWR35_06160 [Guyparkeria sp. WRN-7]
MNPAASPSGFRQAQPPDEVQRAKRRLRLEGESLQAELELAWLPVECGVRLHPWRSLVLAATGGALTGRIDDATDGRLHRVTLRALRPFLRTLIARSGLRRS